LDDGPVLAWDLEELAEDAPARSIRETRYTPTPPSGRKIVDEIHIQRLSQPALRKMKELIAVLRAPFLEGSAIEDGRIAEVQPWSRLGRLAPCFHHLVIM
jgi:hypothetical protein